jgi:hypothetical protein
MNFKSNLFLGAFAVCGILAAASSAQAYQTLGGAYAEGDLLVGFTTGSGNDLIANLGLASSVLSNGNQWNLGSLLTGNLAGLSKVSWGVVGCTAGPNQIYTTIAGTTLPNHFANQSAFNSVVTSLSGLGGDLNGTTGSGTPPASAAGDGSWFDGTDTTGTQTFYSNYGNPNGSTSNGLPSTLDFYTVSQGSTGARTLTGTFSITSAGILTFSVNTTKPTPPKPKIVNITRSSTASTIYFTTTNGGSFTYTYTLRYTNSSGLKTSVSSWPALTTTVTGNGLTNTLTDTSTTSNRFYLISVQ